MATWTANEILDFLIGEAMGQMLNAWRLLTNRISAVHGSGGIERGPNSTSSSHLIAFQAHPKYSGDNWSSEGLRRAFTEPPAC